MQGKSLPLAEHPTVTHSKDTPISLSETLAGLMGANVLAYFAVASARKRGEKRNELQIEKTVENFRSAKPIGLQM